MRKSLTLVAVVAGSYEKATNFNECFRQFKANVHGCLNTEAENGPCVLENKALNRSCLDRITAENITEAENKKKPKICPPGSGMDGLHGC